MVEMTEIQDRVFVTPKRETVSMDWLPYPGSIMRHVLRLPIWGYRLGLSRLMSHMRLMVLTTWGRRTGLPRHTAIEYRVHGSKIYIVSAWGERPNWYRNLLAHPVARIRRGQQTLNAQATIVTDPSEALRVLYLFRQRAPLFYDPVLARMSNRETVTPRTLADISDQFTIVRLDPAGDVVGPPPVETDLKWVWFALGTSLTMLTAALMRLDKRQ